MRPSSILICTFAVFPLAEPLLADSCGPVEIVVHRVGDGVTPLGPTATPVSLVKYSAAGGLLATYSLPTAPSGGQSALTDSGSSSTVGLVTRSTDARFALLAGYGAVPGATVVGTSSTVINRIVGRIDATGAIDTSTSLVDFADLGAPRSAASTDGNALWVAGSTGARYAVLGANSSTELVGTTLRQIAIFESQLYVSRGDVGGTLAAVGLGLPTTPGQPISGFFGLPTTDVAPTGFALFDLSPDVPGLDTLYVSDASDGLQKWTLTGISWEADGVVGGGLDLYRGLAATVELGVVQIFATRLGTELVRLDDASGYGGVLSGSPTLLASAPVNTGFRGVALAPLAEPVGVHCDDFESADLAGWSISVP